MPPSRDQRYSAAKVLFQLLQCLHHLAQLTGSDGKAVQAFGRKTRELDRFIRPAIQNSQITKKISELNNTWATNVTQALISHYQTQVDFLLGSIKGFRLSTNDLGTNMETARNWARRHFGRKLKSDTLAQFDRIVRGIFEPPIKKRVNQAPRQSGPVRQQGGGSPGGRAPGVSSQVSPPRRQHLSPTPESSPPRRDTPVRTSPPPSYAHAANSPPIRPAPPKPPQACVKKFPNLGQRVKGQAIHSVWEIPKITKDILVLGTSNLARITSVGRRDAQVISYPGLKLAQLFRLLEAFKYGALSKSPGLKPSKVIISVGLCDRHLSVKTNEINLKKVVNEAKRQFPDSQVYLAKTPFGRHLDEEEKNTLRSHNALMDELANKHDNVHVIPYLPVGKFQLNRDGIHWTENCANAIINHYWQHLN